MSDLRRHVPPPLLAAQRRVRGAMARVVAGIELQRLRSDVAALRSDVDALRRSLDELAAERTAGILTRFDAVHLAQERRIAAIASRLLRVEEGLSEEAEAPPGTSDARPR